MRWWRATLLAFAVTIAVPILVACSREDSRLDALPRPVLTRDIVLWSQMLGVDMTQVDWRGADAALEAYAAELAMPRARAADSLARALSEASPPKGSELEKFNLSDDDALRRAATLASQWHDQLRSRDDTLFASLAGVAGIGPDVAELMRQLRSIERARMACALPGGDAGPPDALGDALREAVARGEVDATASRRLVQEHATRIAADMDALRRAVLEDSWRVESAARDAHIAAQAEVDADQPDPDGAVDAPDDGMGPEQRAEQRTYEAIGQARTAAQRALKDATVTQLLDAESVLQSMIAGGGPLAEVSRRTLARYALLSDPSRTDRNIRAARFLVLRDPDLDDATRRQSIATLDTLEQVCEQLIVDAWRATLVNIRRLRSGQPELPVPDARSAIGDRATEWLASLPEKTRERLEGVARNWDISESITEHFGEDIASAFRDAQGSDWQDRMREPEPEPEWSSEGERLTIAEVAVLPPVPSPQRLRVAAAIAGLDDAQSAMFVEDSTERWRAFAREQAGSIKSEQDGMESFGNGNRSRAEQMTMARRFYEHGLMAPLRAIQQSAGSTLDDLCARSAALGPGPSREPAIRQWWGCALGPAYTDLQRMLIGETAGPLLREADFRVARLHPDVPTPEWSAMLAKHSEALQSTAQMLLDARMSGYWRLLEAFVEAEVASDAGDQSGANALREQSVARMNASMASLESIAARAQLEALDSLCATLPPREALRVKAQAARSCWPELSFTKGQSRAIAGAERIRNELRGAGATAAAEQVDAAIDRALTSMWDVLRAMPRSDAPALSRDPRRFDKLVRRHASLMGTLESLDNAAIRALRDAALAGQVPQASLTSAVLSPAPVPLTRP
jgi:hypothetical protein